MTKPPLSFTLRDQDSRIDYVVYAYRNLTRDEVIQAVRVFRSSPQGKKVKSGTKYEIITLFGAS